ncbi:MAG: hypothetical protein IKH35_05995 [Prevotella sp.]|nr:hypothetical protein [Prevotella sp.]
MTDTKDTKKNDELRKTRCSILLEEVKERVQELKEYGMSEKEIIAHLHADQSLMPLIISKNYRIFLGDERREVQLEPLVKSLYLLFLRHPEGIIFKNLPDYRQELADIYNKVRPWGLTNRALHSIEDVTNPMLNSTNEKCAKIKKVFVAMLDSSIAEQYYIKGTRGEAKKIALPRELIVWENS